MSSAHQPLVKRGQKDLPIAKQFESNYPTLSPAQLRAKDAILNPSPAAVQRRAIATTTPSVYGPTKSPTECVDRSLDDVQRLQQENEYLRNKWNDASASLADIKVAVSYTLDDQHFSSQWKQIDCLVHNWADKHFSGRKPMSQSAIRLWAKTKTPQALQNLGRFWKAYASSDDHRPLFAQAILWGFLQKDVFAMENRVRTGAKIARGAFWAHPYQQDIAHLNEQLRRSVERQRRSRAEEFDARMRDYIEWRTSNVISIQKFAYGHMGSNQLIISLVERIQAVLVPYAESNAFQSDLREIIELATSLDADMWRQKAYFSLERPVDQGLRYNVEWMDLYATEMLQGDDPNPEVTLVISPSLIKSGDSNGETYRISTTIAKCVVSCDPTFTTSKKRLGNRTWPAKGRSSDTIAVSASTRPEDRALTLNKSKGDAPATTGPEFKDKVIQSLAPAEQKNTTARFERRIANTPVQNDGQATGSMASPTTPEKDVVKVHATNNPARFAKEGEEVAKNRPSTPTSNSTAPVKDHRHQGGALTRVNPSKKRKVLTPSSNKPRTPNQAWV